MRVSRLDASCPSCGHHGLELIYTQSAAPAHSVVLLATRREALDFPRGEIRLGHCPACTFATNAAFEERLMRYGGSCEETQAASGTFRAYHEQLAGDLIERYRLHGGHVVEIGCGKGEFLERLCAMGGNRGTGFDPAYQPGRIELPPGVEVLRENFNGGQDLRGVDLVCCKMTLEHIKDTRDFLRALRASIAERDKPVFIQVPNAARVYRQRAFWDIYYEHCSYFTAAALAGLFRASGYRVEEITETYDGQYLIAHARTAAQVGCVPEPGQRSGVDGDVSGFAAEIEAVKRDWRARIARDHRAGRRIVVWGGGSKAVAFLTSLGLGEEVEFVVDINPRKHGTYLPGSGHEVAAPAGLAQRPPDLLIIMNAIYRPEIERELADIGVNPRVIALF